MTIAISGNGTITGIAANGLPAGIITSTQIASNSRLATTNLPAGSIVQVVNGYMTTQNEGSYASDTDCFSVTITPTSASNKILVQVSMAGCLSRSSGTFGHMWVARGSGRTKVGMFGDYVGGPSSAGIETYPNTSFLDSPATTSATTYYVMFVRDSGAANIAINHYRGGTANDPTLYAVSRMTLTEIVV